MSRKILIAYDHSNEAKRAIQWVLDHSILLPTDTIIIATVVNEDLMAVEGAAAWNTVTATAAEYLVDDYRKRVEDLENHASFALEEIVYRFKKHNLNAIGKLLKGEPSETLTQFTLDEKVDLIIVGNRGLGFLKRKFLGSVSEHLAHHVKCPILIVKNT